MKASIVKQAPETRLSPAELRSRWQQMLEDPRLADIPGKLELNEKGAIELTPASRRHGFLLAFIAGEIRKIRPEGAKFTECPIETGRGIRAPDVAWASPEFVRHHGMPAAMPCAPELCIEVLSPSNTPIEMQEKTAAYLAAGAVEVWLVAEDGAIEMFTERGRVETSELGIVMTLPR